MTNLTELPRDGRDGMEEELRLMEYVQGHMDTRERADFEAQMAADEDLRVRVEEEKSLARMLGPGATAPESDEHETKAAFEAIAGELDEKRRPFALSVAAAAVVSLGVMLTVMTMLSEPDPGFRTLSSEQANRIDAPMFTIVFSSSLSAGQQAELIDQFGLEMIEGPNSVGAYVLRSSSASPDVLESLKAHPGITLAEPVRYRTQP